MLCEWLSFLSTDRRLSLPDALPAVRALRLECLRQLPEPDDMRQSGFLSLAWLRELKLVKGLVVALTFSPIAFSQDGRFDLAVEEVN